MVTAAPDMTFRPIILGLLCCLSTHAGIHSAVIVVYGDSPSAITAAVEAADSGKNVLLVSPVQHLGGIIANGLGSQDVDKRAGNAKPIAGLSREFFIRIARASNPKATSPRYKFRSSFAEKAIDDWLAEKDIPVLRGKRISEKPGSVSKKDGRITSFLCEDGTRVSGKYFIDGTVEGDLMAFSGVSYAWGREGNAKYGETVGGVINPTREQQFRVKVDPYNTPGDPTSGTIFGVQNEPVGTHGDADKSAMGFCLRLPLTKDPANKIPITAPEGYKVSDYEIYRRFLAAGGTNDWLDEPRQTHRRSQSPPHRSRELARAFRKFLRQKPRLPRRHLRRAESHLRRASQLHPGPNPFPLHRSLRSGKTPRRMVPVGSLQGRVHRQRRLAPHALPPQYPPHGLRLRHHRGRCHCQS